MEESEFNERVDSTLEAIEIALDGVDEDIDYETGGGILTVEFEDGSSMIFSRQVATHQLWLAARSGGYHFAWDEAAQDWRCTRSGELLKSFVPAQMLEQGQVTIALV
jgi:CyaY protein